MTSLATRHSRIAAVAAVVVAALLAAACAPMNESARNAADAAATPAVANAAPQDADPYLWLEPTDTAQALDWVKARNAETVAAYASTPAFTTMRDQVLEVMDSAGRIPFVSKMGEFYYNFWRDGEHPLGLWRRTTLAEYRKAKPKWEVLVDVDALARAEGEKWVWHGANCLRPEYRHCLVSLSRGGADAAVVREYDLKSRAFVSGGFTLPEAKTRISWIDADTVYVGTDFGPGSMTKSGYPRIVKAWKRGTPLADATLVYEGRDDDLVVDAHRDNTPGFVRDFVERGIAFYRSETFLRTRDGALRKVEVPDDAKTEVHREWLTVELRSAVDGRRRHVSARAR